MTSAGPRCKCPMRVTGMPARGGRPAAAPRRGRAAPPAAVRNRRRRSGTLSSQSGPAARAASDSGTSVHDDVRRQPAGSAEMAQVLHQAVRHIHAGRGDAGQLPARRAAAAGGNGPAGTRSGRPDGPVPPPSPRAPSPIVPVTQISSPSRAPKRWTAVPGATCPMMVSDSEIGPGVEVVSPPSRVTP